MGTFSTLHSKTAIPKKKVAPHLLGPSGVPNGNVCQRSEERRTMLFGLQLQTCGEGKEAVQLWQRNAQALSDLASQIINLLILRGILIL